MLLQRVPDSECENIIGGSVASLCVLISANFLLAPILRATRIYNAERFISNYKTLSSGNFDIRGKIAFTLPVECTSTTEIP